VLATEGVDAVGVSGESGRNRHASTAVVGAAGEVIGEETPSRGERMCGRLAAEPAVEMASLRPGLRSEGARRDGWLRRNACAEDRAKDFWVPRAPEMHRPGPGSASSRRNPGNPPSGGAETEGAVRTWGPRSGARGARQSMCRLRERLRLLAGPREATSWKRHGEGGPRATDSGDPAKQRSSFDAPGRGAAARGPPRRRRITQSASLEQSEPPSEASRADRPPAHPTGAVHFSFPALSEGRPAPMTRPRTGRRERRPPSRRAGKKKAPDPAGVEIAFDAAERIGPSGGAGASSMKPYRSPRASRGGAPRLPAFLPVGPRSAEGAARRERYGGEGVAPARTPVRRSLKRRVAPSKRFAQNSCSRGLGDWLRGNPPLRGGPPGGRSVLCRASLLCNPCRSNSSAPSELLTRRAGHITPVGGTPRLQFIY